MNPERPKWKIEFSIRILAEDIETLHQKFLKGTEQKQMGTGHLSVKR
jgi:hypothetical protein